MKDKVTINWIDDTAAMAVADRLGLSHTTMIIDVKDIDRKKSAENRARENPIDEDRLEGIRHSYDNGIPMPKIFVRTCVDSTVIAGGNHRTSGLPEYISSIPVHVVECTDAEFELFCFVLNTVVGKGPSTKDRIKRAIDAVQRLGLTRKAAADACGVSEWVLKGELKKASTELRIAVLAPQAKGKMTQTHCLKLGELSNNDNVLRAAAEFVTTAKCGTVEFAEVVAEAKAKNTEAEQVAVFRTASVPYEKGKTVSVPRNVKKKFLIALTNLENLTEKRSWQSLEIQQNEIEAIKMRVKDLQNYLNFLCKENG